MSETMVSKGDGSCIRAIRGDAVKHHGRWFVPTSDETVWVDTWEQFKAVGGHTCFSEDQTQVELMLPEGHKFSIRFMRP